MSDETTLLPCPWCGKKVYIGLYDDRRGNYWWMVHGGMHYDECRCRLFMESCKFELEDETRVEYDEHAMGLRGGLAKRWNTRAEHHVYEQRITGDGSDWGEIMCDAFDSLMAAACDACTFDELERFEAYIMKEIGE